MLAAKQLGLTDRQVRRLVKDYKLYGAEGVVSKQRGQISNHKYSDKKIEAIKRLVSMHYYDFGPKFAAEKLDEKHGIKVSKETLRQWMIDWSLWLAKRQKNAQIHPQRDRRDCFGELTQIVCKDLNNVITLVCKGKILDYTCHARAKRNADIVDAKQLGSKVDSIVNKAKKHTQRQNTVDHNK